MSKQHNSNQGEAHFGPFISKERGVMKGTVNYNEVCIPEAEDGLLVNLDDLKTDAEIASDTYLTNYRMHPCPTKEELDAVPQVKVDSYVQKFREIVNAGEAFRSEGTAGQSVNEALRFNSGKIPYGNLPMDTLSGAARVMQKGELKYSRANWRLGYSDLMSPLHSLMRHVAEVQYAIENEDHERWIDSESGEAHLNHVLTSAMLLVHSARLKGWKC